MLSPTSTPAIRRRVTGDYPAGAQALEQALDLARQISSSWDEAHALAGLGRCALAAGLPATEGKPAE
jgi:hypothetical protein